jgi:hypothetical protein
MEKEYWVDYQVYGDIEDAVSVDGKRERKLFPVELLIVRSHLAL